MWPQCWDLQGPRGLEQRELRNLNLGDLKKGPNGGVSPTPQKKKNVYRAQLRKFSSVCLVTSWSREVWSLLTIPASEVNFAVEAVILYL
jgi:predicted transcriptional regulator